MRTLLAVLFVALVAVGCASRPAAKSAYSVDSYGRAVTPATRSAMDGDIAAGGKQELFGLYIPLGPFGVKAGIDWDGTTFTPPIPGPFAAQAAPCAEYAPAFQSQAACAESVVEEPYTVRVPVQTYREETRVRRYKVETYQRKVPMPECAPAPQVAPQFAPCDPPPPPSGSASDPCPNGCCDLR